MYQSTEITPLLHVEGSIGRSSTTGMAFALARQAVSVLEFRPRYLRASGVAFGVSVGSVDRGNGTNRLRVEACAVQPLQ